MSAFQDFYLNERVKEQVERATGPTPFRPSMVDEATRFPQLQLQQCSLQTTMTLNQEQPLTFFERASS